MLLKPVDFKTKLMAYKVTTMFTQKFNRHENYFTAAAIEKTKSVGRSVLSRKIKIDFILTQCFTLYNLDGEKQSSQ